MGDPVRGQACPCCRRRSVVYDGNYYCESCPWTMGDDERPKRIIKAYLIQRWLRASAADDPDEMARIGIFLAQYAD
jgi:uncharacterized protein CbrC (UPF0167 family)